MGRMARTDMRTGMHLQKSARDHARITHARTHVHACALVHVRAHNVNRSQVIVIHEDAVSYSGVNGTVLNVCVDLVLLCAHSMLFFA